MKIIRLTSENVKRLTAVDISPNGTIVGIGGKNGAGKSSVLDSIAYALGGEKLAPAEPIRKGESNAKIVVDLGDVIVTRRFLRTKLPCNCSAGMVMAPGVKESDEHTKECASHCWDETRSTLAVTNKEGAKYPSPQAMLDKLLGKLTFDPLAFKDEEPKKQNEILRRLTNLDFSMIDTQRKAAAERRAMHKKTLAIAEGKLTALPHFPEAGFKEVSIEEISTEIKRGQELQRYASDAEQTLNKIADTLNTLRLSHAGAVSTVESLERQLITARQLVQAIEVDIEIQRGKAEAAVQVFEEAKKAVPNFQQLDSRLREIDDLNTKVRSNNERIRQEEEVNRLKKLVEEEDDLVKAADAKKEETLQAARFPVEGLGLTDDGVTFNGLPLEQASASEQLRISVAIGLALNPSIKVLLVRNGNLLDDDNLKLLGEQAEEAKAQVWMEFVTSSGEGMTVLMEDGHVKS